MWFYIQGILVLAMINIIAVLGVTVSTFDVVLHRAMAALRKALPAGEEGGR